MSAPADPTGPDPDGIRRRPRPEVPASAGGPELLEDAAAPGLLRPLAAIDIGTNSVHLVVARPRTDHRFEIVAREKEMVRLGSGGGDMKHLHPSAIERAVAVLRRYALVAAAHDAEIVAVATSAVREATNGGAFCRRVRTEAGIDVQVISGREEARLIHLGVLSALPVADRRVLVCDIGGGSTELIIGEGDEMLAARSLKLGSLRLTRRFFGGRVVHPGAVDACRRHIRSTLVPFVREARRFGFETAVGSSGTVAALAALVCHRRGDPEPRTWRGFRFSAEELGEVTARIIGAGDTGAIARIGGMDPRRADIILAGALVCEQVMDALAVDELTVSDRALREGLLVDAIARRTGGTLHHLRDLRRRSVEHLASVFDEDPDHSRRVADHALALFDELAGWHGLGDDARELLWAAARLANVGLFISHDRHHQHSYYVIRNTERLSGFTDREIEIIAQVARYHRKSAPKRKHAPFAALDPGSQRLVRTLAAILRVAIGLDRQHAGAVERVRARLTDDAVVVEVTPGDGADVTLEVHTAGERAGLLAELAGRPVRIVTAAPAHDGARP